MLIITIEENQKGRNVLPHTLGVGKDIHRGGCRKIDEKINDGYERPYDIGLQSINWSKWKPTYPSVGGHAPVLPPFALFVCGH